MMSSNSKSVVICLGVYEANRCEFHNLKCHHIQKKKKLKMAVDFISSKKTH